MKSFSHSRLENEEMGLSHGDEKSISQNEDHFEEMEEMVEISFFVQPPMKIPSQSSVTKRRLKPTTVKDEVLRRCTEPTQKTSSLMSPLERSSLTRRMEPYSTILRKTERNFSSVKVGGVDSETLTSLLLRDKPQISQNSVISERKKLSNSSSNLLPT